MQTYYRKNIDMKKLVFALVMVIGVLAFAACRDNVSYADQKKREVNAINKFIADSAVSVITEEEFYAQDSTTDVSKNEYVLINSNGVYMQIIRKGGGQKLKNGETATVLCRFTEENLLTDSLQLTNDILYYSAIPDKMSVTNTTGTFSGSFVEGQSVMYSFYGSAAVPQGWLTPLTFINLGRYENPGEDIAKVKLIVPHDQGQTGASQGVYPCLYTITYQRGL